jgi:hypothetical protein
MRPNPLFPLLPAAAASAALFLTACASLPGGTDGASAQAAAASAAASAASRPAAAVPPAPGQPQPFATVIKDAKKTDGLFAIWQKDDKVWLELKPEDFNKPFFLGPKISQGLGEAGLYGGTMVGRWGRWGRTQLVEFRRVFNQVQLVAVNTGAVAAPNTPEGRAVRAGFAPSLVASTSVASQPHPERKTVLVDANGLFLGDLLGLGITLQRTFRQGYAFDARNSSITAARGKDDAVFFEVSAHYATASIGQATPGQPGPAPTTPNHLPDVRSMFLGLHYSISKLPEQPMKPRLADARVGYFTTNTMDFASDLARTPRVRYVNRWRLEKKDPAAALSEPVKPITYWLDRTIPLQYREAISKGILAWNAAFEKIGFKNAIEVKVQPDDADFDTLDIGVASVRWMTNGQAQFGAIGPSQVDPRSGEILDADIGFESLSSRGVRAFRSQVLDVRNAIDWTALMQLPSEERLAQRLAQRSGAGGLEAEECHHAEHAAEQLGYALDVLEARGELDPDSPEAQQWVLDYLTDTTMHEVGHTLGLRHNFRSSRIYTDKQMSDADFARAHGLAGSVMEYAPINLARPGDKPTFAWQTTLGPYDYWAIEYAYKPLPPGTSGPEETAALQKIAARSAEPELAYGTDEDNYLGLDAESLQFDLGDDPVVFAAKRLDIGRDLIKRQETRALKPTADYAVLRRSISFAVRDMGRAAGILLRQVGGMRTLRDFPGSGRDPMQPVPTATQRQALDLLARNVLAADALVLSPALQRKLAPDFGERGDALFDGESVATDFSVAAIVVELQRAVLGYLMTDGVAQRLLENESKLDRGAPALRLGELYERLDKEVWSELRATADIPAMRRELQRDHVNRLSAAVLRPTAFGRADARSLLRVQAQELAGRLEAAAKASRGSAETRAHLKDSAQTLRAALAAPLSRSGT